MNLNFKTQTLAAQTADALERNSYNSWIEVCRMLNREGFNHFEAEAILRSDIALLGQAKGQAKSTAGDLRRYLLRNSIAPHGEVVNKLVMDRFGKEYDLELNENGQPCRRGRPVCGSGTILVPLGTPACCDPTTETYACM